MFENARIAVVIPALNEEASIGQVIEAIPDWVDDIVVADNGSTDRTAAVATSAGARVVDEPRKGYGQACLTALAALHACEIVVFVDGDLSDYPEQMDRLVTPIARNEADMVIGSRVRGRRERGALTPQARFGNWLSCRLIRLFWNVTYTDLGPFRAIRMSCLQRLRMQDRDYGWTVEMQVKAAQVGLRAIEVPVDYRKRIGQSKVSGTIKGVVSAGTKILGTILLAAIRPPKLNPQRLIVFTRYPTPGQVKTRLIPVLGEKGAAQLYAEMTEHTLARIGPSEDQPSSPAITLCYTGGDANQMADWLGSDCDYQPQGDGDLGQRLCRAFERAFDRGVRRVVVIGTDCPGINAPIITKAFEALRSHDVVLGPAADGGYYLIGLSQWAPDLFVEIPWGTSQVFEATVCKAKHQSLKIAPLEMLSDVDRPEDLPVWQRCKDKLPPTSSP